MAVVVQGKICFRFEILNYHPRPMKEFRRYFHNEAILNLKPNHLEFFMASGRFTKVKMTDTECIIMVGPEFGSKRNSQAFTVQTAMDLDDLQLPPNAKPKNIIIQSSSRLPLHTRTEILLASMARRFRYYEI